MTVLPLFGGASPAVILSPRERAKDLDAEGR
jgi:hypothetical protein